MFDPATTSALISGGAKVLGAAVADGGPVTSGARDFNQKFDSSGWQVNFGSGGISATRSDSAQQNEGAMPANFNTLAMIAAGLVVVALVVKRLRKG